MKNPLVEKRTSGLVHVFYGSGAGKSSRAVGMAVRAAGQTRTVHFVQFMKSGDSGEVTSFKNIPNILYYCPGDHPFVFNLGPQPVHFEHARKALDCAYRSLQASVDLLICDEILNAFLFGVIQTEQIIDLMNSCRGLVDLVLTGRDAPPEVLTAADHVTEFIEKKHPYTSGVKPRRGIEY